jgi:hypothetical protein
MKQPLSFRLGLVASLLLTTALSALAADAPLRLLPANPHYFEFRGRPTVLIGSGEHYGAVLNLDFNYVWYLNTLARDGLNVTRTFSGAYVEPAGAFGIASNTLAPVSGRFICPWARSQEPGNAGGGNKFDLARWDDAYFRRLKDFVSLAGQRRVVVELNLFCPFYGEPQWRLSPMNAANNINGVGAIARTNAYTLDRAGGLLTVQENLVRKLVTELRAADNLYYEICNEPYFGGVTLPWQRHIADLITATEDGLGCRHLISQNIANDKATVTEPFPSVSIFNFHYASPPDTVAMNYGLDRVIGDNETGFNTTNDAPYRIEAWNFLLAGGALFNHLDYSFVARHEDGSFRYPASQPGGGNPVFRRQMRGLADFMRGLDFTHMRPNNGVILDGVPAGQTARALVLPDHAWAIYLARIGRPWKEPEPADSVRTGTARWGERPREPSLPQNVATARQSLAPPAASATLRLVLPPGAYRAQWLEPATGRWWERQQFDHAGGVVALSSPAYATDLALRITRLR